jgi:hypothetical protein
MFVLDFKEKNYIDGAIECFSMYKDEPIDTPHINCTMSIVAYEHIGHAKTLII